MTWVPDTSWLYALFDENDVHHPKAIKEGAEREPILIPPLIAAELAYLMQKRYGKERALATMADVKRLPHATIPEEVAWESTLELWVKHPVSLADANAIAWAHKRRAGLRTFDERQRQILAKLT